MGRKWPGPDVPTGGTLLPDGLYELSIETIDETTSNSGHLMYKGTFRVVEPAAFAGSPYWENFNIGSDADPNADDPETWKRSIGAQILGRVIDAALVPRTDDVDADIASATGQRIVASISQDTDDGKRDPKYKGTVRNRVRRWYKRGEQAVGVTAGLTSTGVTPKPAATVAPKAAAASAVTPAKAAAPAKAPPQPKAPAAVSCSIEGCAWTGERRDFPAHVQAAHAEDEE